MKCQRVRCRRKLVNRRVRRILARTPYTITPMTPEMMREAFCVGCGLIKFGCVCAVRQRHQSDCHFLMAAGLQVEMACDHGFQACPVCDPCTCVPKVDEVGIR